MGTDIFRKNVTVLESDEKYVGSISKVNYYDINLDMGSSQRNSKLIEIKKFYSYEYYPKLGKYSDRVSFYLRLNRAENIYSLFRTNILKRCIDRCIKN